MVYKFGLDALQFLLPTSCILCNGSTLGGLCLCPGCLDDLPVHSISCNLCALPIGAPGICGKCLRKPPAYDAVTSPWLYESPVSHLVQQLKYSHRFEVARLFAAQLFELAQSADSQPDLLISVPLHRTRLRRRGYNQAWEVTRRLSKLSGIPASHILCKRIRATPSQTGLTAKQRRHNLRDAFRVTEDVQGLHIAVVDDVMTTGSTLQAIAEVLKQSGASKVTGLVAARAA